MEVSYCGELVMPSSYRLLDEEEMTYLEGGGSVNTDVVAWVIDVGCALGGIYASACGEILGRGLISLIKFSISILGNGNVVLQCIGIIPSAPHGKLSVLGSIFTISLAHTWNKNIFFQIFSLNFFTKSVNTYLSSE